MDNIKIRATEKFDAIHGAARNAADVSKSKAQDIYVQTIEALRQLRLTFQEIWHHELILEGRLRISEFARDTAQRIREGTVPLSPVLLYKELKTLFEDRVWRRSMLIFICGFAAGGACGALAALKISGSTPQGPHARALHTQPDHSVLLLEDAVAPGPGPHEVLVRVVAFSVGARERRVLRRHAHVLRALLHAPTVTVGGGFAGVVLDAGREASELQLGDEVWGALSEWSGGAAQELLTVRHTRVSKRPANISTIDAAALPWAGCHALAALDKLQLGDDKTHLRVVVLGAASETGCVLLQLLATRAHVTALAPRLHHQALKELGASETIELESVGAGGGMVGVGASWAGVEALAGRRGPWDAALLCGGAGCPQGAPSNTAAILKSTANRNAIIDLRPRALLTDRLPMPLAVVFGISFYAYRTLRWLLGQGSHTDWLEDRHLLTEGLNDLAKLVDDKNLAPVLDKVFLPYEFETALAHACSDDAIGTTVIRFP